MEDVSRLGSARGHRRRRTPSSRRAGSGNHQFQRPNSDTAAGTNSVRTTSASSSTPPASPVASILTSTGPVVPSEAKAKNTISAALVTRRPVRAMPPTTA